ncbi:DUF3006 family protein [Paucisalibacillus globulus]|uniref:DUF3006 family protein n=1 Tax=Paucisalibacillus globulus TaxID=351095 RepID=UPI00041CCF1E|nr:DUF3006 family protein [Paucisalibacillus globulus]
MGRFFRRKSVLIICIFFIIVCSGLVTIFAEKTSLENDGTHLNSISVKGVVDRIENVEYAIILVEELELEFVVEISDFEAELAKDIWVDLVLVSEKIKGLSIDWKKTKEEKQKVKELIKELRGQIGKPSSPIIQIDP